MVTTTSTESFWPILICLLGDFRVLRAGRPMAIHGGKAEAILSHLAFRPGRGVPRDTILEAHWPGQAPALAGQCLNSVVHSLRKSLSGEIQGEPPILHLEGTYRLNQDAGVGVDVALFDSWLDDADRNEYAGNLPGATACYIQAIQTYRGDLITGTNIDAVIERERLRARFLAALAHMADYYFHIKDYTACLRHAQQLLEYDACREDAHRLIMRCYVRQGQRAQSLRQYRLCENILRAEFDTAPEATTVLLFNQVRLDPDSI